MDVAATLTIGDETWEFDQFRCAFDQNDFPFNASAFGEDTSGVRVQLTADIFDGSGQEITAIELDDIDNALDPTVSWRSESSFGGETELMIDGDQVTGSGLFDDQLTVEIEQIPGNLQATCTETLR
jgi:hypothetical protein